jgi:hypothetical protein
MSNIDWTKQPCLYECKFKIGEKLLTEQESIEKNSWFDTIEEKKSVDNILSINEIYSYISTISLWVFFLTFGLRYLFYATKWSIKTISSKE